MAFDELFCLDRQRSDSWSFRIRFAFREHQLSSGSDHGPELR
jgi:hypothetical protein